MERFPVLHFVVRFGKVASMAIALLVAASMLWLTRCLQRTGWRRRLR